ncbi:MAG TPA: radical SAM protein [Myxococcota bacterium]|nr:radical SAM protein [Myxococcota bacterium]HRY97309.1 radical SAM protein [Myxococcota bacterium]HSA23894.1 radical SAM protein [Myxococcota bacterium]
MIVREIQARSILSRSKIYDYVVNPYVGCRHGCSYCYARFMKRFTGHREAWGEFVDAKINAADLLRRELTRKQPGRVWVSGVCDAYQPLEKRYRLTRQCLELLFQHGWPVTVQTRSPLVLRDLDLLRAAQDLEVGLSVTTAEDRFRRLFERCAPPIPARLEALAELHAAGVRTFAMIAPLLPGAEGLAEALRGKVDRVLIDRMNYAHANALYRRHQLERELSPGWFEQTARRLSAAFGRQGVECQLVFY